MLKKTPLEFVEEHLALDTPEFARDIGALSPSRRVPALHVGSVVIWDSLAIGEYLAERYPESGLLPAATGARALARCVAAEMHAGFGALRNALPFNGRARGRRVPIDDATAADIERVAEIWRGCLARRGDEDGGLCGGFTLADAMYVPVALRFVTYGVALDEVCTAYVKWCQNDPHVRDWLAAAAREDAVIEREEVGR